MSVSDSYEPVLLVGDGSETDFDFDFSVFDDTDVVVALVDPDTLEGTDQELGTDYSVNLNTSTTGGTVVFGTAPDDGTLVSIRRNIPLTQSTDIPSGGLFRESQIENALDRAILIIQQLSEQLDRALLQTPYTDPTTLIFPAASAGELIGWNDDGDALENKEFISTADIQLASQSEAEGGTNNTSIMTPLRTKQAIDALAPAVADTQIAAATGTTANKILKLDANAKIPAVDGSLLTNLNVNEDQSLAGSTVQVVSTQTGAVATGTTVIPNDDTIPQKTEGDEYMTLAITPKSATNILIIEATGYFAVDSDNDTAAMALFQGDNADALAVSGSSVSPSGNQMNLEMNLRHVMVAGVTDEITFKIRAGYVTGTGTLTFNGVSGARKFGGKLASNIKITEIKG